MVGLKFPKQFEGDVAPTMEQGREQRGRNPEIGKDGKGTLQTMFAPEQ